MAQPLAQLFYWLSLDTGDGTEEWIQTNYPRVVACALLAIGLFLASLCITVIFDLFGCSSSFLLVFHRDHWARGGMRERVPRTLGRHLHAARLGQL
jgi:hypothetical protein